MVARGITVPVAEQLAQEHEPSVIKSNLELFDQEEANGAAKTPGWLVSAIAKNFAATAKPRQPDKPEHWKIYSYPEWMYWRLERGIPDEHFFQHGTDERGQRLYRYTDPEKVTFHVYRGGLYDGKRGFSERGTRPTDTNYIANERYRRTGLDENGAYVYEHDPDGTDTPNL